MLQSEYDAIMSQKRIKILLIILTALVVAVVLYVVIKAGRENMPVSEPAVVTSRDAAAPPSQEEIRAKLDELSKVPEGVTPPPQLPPEEIQKKLDELSKKPDGTTPPQPSQDEIMKRLNELSKKK